MEKKTMIKFNTQFFDELESANYFGDEHGIDQDSTRRNWIAQMMRHGYEFGGTYENDDQFERECGECLSFAIKEQP